MTLKPGKTKFTVVGGKLKERELGDYGLPKNCTQSCTLTSTDLEDIKFKDLDQGSGDITVSSNAGKVSLEIKNVGGTNRYIFSNSSQDVDIKKGEDKKVTLTSAKKSQFTGSDNKLSKLALDTYGVPSSCSTSSTCTLTADDLGEIKFEELQGTGTVSPTKGTISLTIDSSDTTNKRFTFENSGSEITIQKPSDTTKKVTLSKGKNRFKGTSDNKMKKIELDEKGIPKDCSGTCTLTVDDLKEVKFPELEGQSGTATVSPENQTISLNIDSSKKQYSFNNGSNQITITKGSKSTVLVASGPTVFTEENGKLVKETSLEALNKKIKEAGFPVEESCSGNDKCCQFKEGDEEIECKLTKEKFKKLKFKEFDGGEVDENTLGSIDSNSDFKVKIKKIKAEERGNYLTGTDLKFIFDGLSADLSVQQKNKGEKTIYLKKNSDTEFILDSSNQLERAWTRQRLGEKVGLTCDSSFGCTVKGPINLITSSSGSNQKHEGMTKSSTSAGDKFKVSTKADYREGYRFKVENSDITLSKEGQSQKLSTGHCYEAKWDTDNKWWLAHKADTC